MSLSFRLLRSYMEKNDISYYFLANQGIDAQTLQRIRHDKPITTKTLERLCRILNCQPGQLIEYCDDNDENITDIK